MLKRKALRKILITSLVSVILLTIYLIPMSKKTDKKLVNYVDVVKTGAFLLNDNEQLVKVDLLVKRAAIKEQIKDVVNKLCHFSENKKLTTLIPKGTKLLDTVFDENIVNLNFSKEFLNVDENSVTKLVESIAYSIFEFKEVNAISIYVDDVILTKYFAVVPANITREYGINKKYDISRYDDVTKVVIYYADVIDDDSYYVPVTKYVNDKRDKIKIIIDELSSSYVSEPNLVTFLNKNTKLINYEISNDTMVLNFNNSIFIDNNTILEEVIYTISHSVFDNYSDIDTVSFKVDGIEIVKNQRKAVV